MWTLPVVHLHPPTDTLPGLASPLEGIEVDAFVLQRTPEPLYHNVVLPSALAVHRDTHRSFIQRLRKVKARELASLVGIEYLRSSILPQSLLQGRNAELRLKRVAEPP